MMPLTERYRPHCWDEVIGQDAVVRTIRQLKGKDALGGRAYWISGKSGTGKTTIARLLACELAGPWGTEELDAGQLTVARLAEIERQCQSRDMFGPGGRAFIVNEAHGLRKDVVRQLLVMLERLPNHVVFIFTTTTEGQAVMFDGCDDAGPLLSRCLPLPLSQQSGKALAKRAMEIARAEGFDGRPDEWYLSPKHGLGTRCKGNMRAMLQAIEAGEALAGKDGE